MTGSDSDSPRRSAWRRRAGEPAGPDSGAPRPGAPHPRPSMQAGGLGDSEGRTRSHRVRSRAPGHAERQQQPRSGRSRAAGTAHTHRDMRRTRTRARSGGRRSRAAVTARTHARRHARRHHGPPQLPTPTPRAAMWQRFSEGGHGHKICKGLTQRRPGQDLQGAYSEAAGPGSARGSPRALHVYVAYKLDGPVRL